MPNSLPNDSIDTAISATATSASASDSTTGDIADPKSDAPAGARWLLLSAVAFGMLALGLGWLAKSATIASPVSEVESAYPTPDFRLASLDGPEIGPADYPGDVVLVELWATWCGPCRLQARFLEELHQEFEGKDVHFLAISIGEDEATVREFVERSPFPYPVLLDPEDTLGRRYEIYGLPTVMIIDRQGAISFLETGVSDLPRLRHALEIAGA